MMFRPNLVVFVGLLLGACGDYSNDVLEQDAEFLSAVPSKFALEMRVAENQPRCDECQSKTSQLQTYTLGSRAQYLDFAVKLTSAYNQSIFGFLDMVDWLTHLVPPSFREHDRRDWGPFRSDENQDVEVRFMMLKKTQEAQAEYELHYQMRWYIAAQTRDEAWQDCVLGQLKPVIGVRRGQGTLTIDLDKCSKFNNVGEQGNALVEYDTAPDALNPTGKTQMSIQFYDFLGKEEEGEDSKPLTATYDYAEASDYSGRFIFEGEQDIVIFDPLTSQPEHYEINVRWNSERAGTANVKLTQGDLGNQSIEVDECWDESLARVYYNESHDPTTKEGELSNCVAF